MTESAAISMQRRRLAQALRKLRLDIGYSGDRLAGMLGWTQSKVSKIETGRTRPSPQDVDAWASATGASPEDRQSLVALATAVRDEPVNLRDAHQGGLALRQREIAELEVRTASIAVFHPSLVPALLQTAEYAKRTLAPVAETGDVGAAVALRMERQHILYAGTTRLMFLLPESALRWQVGAPSTMLAQLDRLHSVATLDSVTVAVLPFAAELVAPCPTPFEILNTPADNTTIVIETLTADLVVNASSELQAYQRVFDQLAATALDEERSLAMLADARSHYRNR
jgi:transcriptional regulator with XRE-family HTH domain